LFFAEKYGKKYFDAIDVSFSICNNPFCCKWFSFIYSNGEMA